MVSVKWCLEQRGGLDIVEPSKTVSDSYIRMAEESIRTLPNVRDSRIWTAATAYYVFYYSLYSLMIRLGVKCGIHSCSLEFMKRYLGEFYGLKDVEMMESAFGARIDLQYYSDRPVDEGRIKDASGYCKTFFIKTKDALSKLTEKQAREIRETLKAGMKK